MTHRSLLRLHADLEAILANLLLDKRKQDREVGYGGKWELMCMYTHGTLFVHIHMYCNTHVRMYVHCMFQMAWSLFCQLSLHI